MFLSLIAGIVAFVLTVFAMPHFIRIYQIKKIGGQQMHEDVKQHLAKAGTPTMGGTVFLTVGILVASFLACLSKSKTVLQWEQRQAFFWWFSFMGLLVFLMIF